MRICLKDNPNSIFVETRRRVEWINDETGSDGEPLKRRIPQKKKREFHKIFGFIAGGMYYICLRQMALWCIDRENDVYRDSYGIR